jgi:hypothetical protein
LSSDLALLRPFWLKISGLRGLRQPSIEACRQALAGDTLKTPLARAAVWNKLLEDAIQSNRLTPDDLLALDHGGFRSPFLYRARMAYSWPRDLRLTRSLCALLARHAGSDKLTEQERQLLTQPWDALPASPGAPDWPKFQ